MTDPRDQLLKLAKALSDGDKVDWSRAEADAQDAEEREVLDALREIEMVAELHRTLRREAPPRSVATTVSSWGPLEISEKIGEGGSAEVFRARDPRLDRAVALKLFRHGQWMNLEQRRTVLLEGQNLARLRHENVVSVYGAGDHGGRVGIWMELVEGRTLSEIVTAEGPRSASEASQIGIAVCRALAAVHRQNLLHVDIKAQNVKREKGGRIVLMDFSSSRRADDSPGNPESDPVGTPLYMAPELWQQNTPTVESDIYALGVLLYYLVTGAFPVRAPSIEFLRRAHAAGVRHFLRDERPDLPEAFVRTVEKALSVSPRDRYRSAGAFEAALLAQQPAPSPPPAPLPEPASIDVWILVRMARVGSWMGGIFFVLVALGFLTSTALNVVLGRPSSYAPEFFSDWFVWGARSLLGPAYHAISTLVPFLGIYIVARLVFRLETVRRPLTIPTERIGRAVSRLGLMHIAVLGVLGVGALTAWHYDLLDAIYRVVEGRVDRETLALLSPANGAYHLAYRRHFTLLIIALSVATIVIRVRMKARKQPNGVGPAIAVAAVIGCAAILMEFPWQILWQASFPRVEYGGERCYEVGELEQEVLLFCPLSSPSTTRIVQRGDERLLPAGIVESVFTLPEE